jgi:hypothetical protein
MLLSRRLFVATSAATLAGCGTKLNPFNWFKRSEPREKVVVEEPEDPRPLVDTVLTMTVEAIPGGAVVRARGVTPTQGWWDAELVPLDQDEAGTLVYEFRLNPPTTTTDVNTQRSREIDVAIFVSDYKLDTVREIVVQGANNARASRR